MPARPVPRASTASATKVSKAAHAATTACRRPEILDMTALNSPPPACVRNPVDSVDARARLYQKPLGIRESEVDGWLGSPVTAPSGRCHLSDEHESRRSPVRQNMVRIWRLSLKG